MCAIVCYDAYLAIILFKRMFSVKLQCVFGIKKYCLCISKEFAANKTSLLLTHNVLYGNIISYYM